MIQFIVPLKQHRKMGIFILQPRNQLSVFRKHITSSHLPLMLVQYCAMQPLPVKALFLIFPDINRLVFIHHHPGFIRKNTIVEKSYCHIAPKIQRLVACMNTCSMKTYASCQWHGCH
ncbi:hypothetical protein ACVDAB_002995 [Salmonella enterica subsp. enterica serovar Newport]|nr:hypothetical protein [Salmonella enterica subsp. enterica serovar Newport]